MVFQMGKDLKVFAYANCPLACTFVVKIKLKNSQHVWQLLNYLYIHRIAETGRNLGRCTPTPLLRATASCSGPCPVESWAPPRMETSLGNLLQCSVIITIKRLFLCLNKISCISVCAHFLLSSYWAQLRRVRLRCLYFHSPGICIRG